MHELVAFWATPIYSLCIRPQTSSRDDEMKRPECFDDMNARARKDDHFYMHFKCPEEEEETDGINARERG